MKSLASAAVTIAVGLAALAAPRVAVAATTYEVVAKIPSNDAFFVAVDPSLHRVYSPNRSPIPLLYVVDENTNSVTAQLHVGAAPYSIAVDPTTHAVFVGDLDSNTVSVLEPTNLELVAAVPLADAPEMIAVDPSTHTFYVLGLRTLTVVDSLANVVTDTVVMEGNSMAVDPTTHTIYVTDFDANALWIVDGSTHTIVDAVPIPLPYAVDVDPALHTVFVGSLGEYHTVSRVDTGTHAVVATVPVGMTVLALAVDPVSHAVYMSNTAGSDNLVEVMDGNTNTVVATFTDYDGPLGIAVDSVTHTAFVSGAELWKILAFCNDPICVSSTIFHFGALVANGRGIRGAGLALPLLIAGISESIGYQAGACRAMRVFVSGVENADGPLLTDVLATDSINQAEAIQEAMGCF